MLVFAAIGVFGAGMLAIAAGIPIKDFGFGNTLILSGVLAWCTSAIMITLWACFRDLKGGIEKPDRRPRDTEQATTETRPALPQAAQAPAQPQGWPESIPERTPTPPASSPTPPPPAPAAAETRDQRRNILFSSNRRPPTPQPPREPPRPSEAAVQMAPASPSPEPRPVLDEPRPVPRRVEQPPRTVRPVSTVGPRESVSAPPLPPAPSPPPAPPPPVPPAEPPSATAPPPDRPARSDGGANVTVLKSGVVDGMAYWLFSDGSIEAQMPEGMMRFTSIDELRAHLDKRP